ARARVTAAMAVPSIAPVAIDAARQRVDGALPNTARSSPETRGRVRCGFSRAQRPVTARRSSPPLVCRLSAIGRVPDKGGNMHAASHLLQSVAKRTQAAVAMTRIEGGAQAPPSMEIRHEGPGQGRPWSVVLDDPFPLEWSEAGV